MNVITLRDYAKQNNISYEAVRKQVVRYADELEDHIIKDGRQQFLDEEAVTFLNAKRQKNPVAIIQQDKDDRIRDLENEIKRLLATNTEQANQIAELAQWKADNAVAIAEANYRQQLLEEKTATIAALEAQNADLSDENTRIDREAREAQKNAQKTVDELSRVYEEEQKRHEDEEHLLKQRAEVAAAYAAELAEYISLPFWKRLRTKKPVLKEQSIEDEDKA